MLHSTFQQAACELAFGVVVGLLTLGCSGDPDSDGNESAGAGGSAAGGSGQGGSGALGGSGVAGAAGSSGAGGATSPVPQFSNRLASTNSGTCAIARDGRLVCWGTPPDGSAWDVPGGSFTSVSAESFVCGVRDDRSLVCFVPPGVSEDVSLAPSGEVAGAEVGRSLLCSLDSSGAATCRKPDAPLTSPIGRRFSRISAGHDFACGIEREGGAIVCWGNPGTAGDCGNPPAVGQLEAPSGEFIDLASTLFQSCAIRRDGSLACWGAGSPSHDPLQLNCDERIHYGQATPPAGTFTQVSVGPTHACAVRTDSTLACWGAGMRTGDCAGDLDQCGQADPPNGSGFVEVSAGFTHSCALKTDGGVVCWGSNTGGRATPPEL